MYYVFYNYSFQFYISEIITGKLQFTTKSERGMWVVMSHGQTDILYVSVCKGLIAGQTNLLWYH